MPYFYVFIIVSIACYLAGDYLGKLWVSNGKLSLLLTIFSLHLIASLMFLLALKKSDSLSFTVLMGTLIGLIGGVFIGHYFFAERFNLPQYFGLGFAVIAIFLLTFPFQSTFK